MLKVQTGHRRAPVIGIDASRAVTERATGIERYCWQVIEHLKPVIPPTCRVRLYSETPLTGAMAELPPHWESRVLRPWGRFFWSELRLGWEMLLHPVDALFVPGRALPLILPPRVLVTLHDLGFIIRPDAYRRLNRLYQLWTHRRYLRRARLLTVSSFTRAEVGRLLGEPLYGVAVTPLAVDVARYAPAAPGQTPPAGLPDRYLLFVGRLEDKKNIHGLLMSYAGLVGRLGEAAPALVLGGLRGRGADAAFASLPQAVRARVRELGYVPDDALPRLYAGALAVIFPSFYEGFGLPVLEAFAAGVPVACSRIASLPEVAGEAAAYFDPTRPDQITDAMERLVTDESHRRTLIVAGYRRVAAFSWNRTAEQTWQELRLLLTKNLGKP
jgi:glycosyltransferase involved in cell wall biosynthesis